MTNNKLIIIGNGFDLAHNLKTDYVSFIKDIEHESYGLFSKNKYKDLIVLDTYSSKNNRLLKILIDNFKDGNWSDIEATYFTILNNYNSNGLTPY